MSVDGQMTDSRKLQLVSRVNKDKFLIWSEASILHFGEEAIDKTPPVPSVPQNAACSICVQE